MKINMWSGPRNVSTALMYSFAQRSDTKVVDEPFYAHYLLQSGAEHPGRAEVLESQPSDPQQVLRDLLSERSAPVLFLKNMAHHMTGMKESLHKLISECKHLFLIRHPREMLPSLHESLPHPSLRDTAYKKQFELFCEVRERGRPMQVIDAAELLKAPRQVLKTLCDNFHIPFESGMLEWEKGPIPEDGVWARYWYDSVHRSTGFLPYQPKEEPFPEELIPLYEECKPFYDNLFAHAIKS